MTTAATAALVVIGLSRFAAAGFLPAFSRLSGDFAATFPTAYFARLRPDFSTAVVWQGWNYGPMFHFLTLPLFLAPTWAAVPKIWATVNALFVALSFVMCCRLSRAWRDVSPNALVILAALWMLFQPLATCFAQGNIELLEMTMILVALVLLEGSSGSISGVLLGVAAMIKFLPVGFLLWLGARGRWRAAAFGAVAVAAIVLLTAATMGWGTSISLKAMRDAGDVPIVGMHELSVTSALLHRTAELDRGAFKLYWFPSARRDAALAAGGVTSVLLAIAVGGVIWARRRQPVTSAEIGMLFMTMFMIQPWNHDYYYVFALVPFSMLFLRAVAARDRVALALLAVSYVLMSPPVPYSVINQLRLLSIPFAYAVNFYDLPVAGGLILWIAVTAQTLSEQPAGGSRAAKVSIAAVALIGAVFAVAQWTRAAAVHAGSAPAALGLPVTLDLPFAPSSGTAFTLAPDGKRLAYVATREGESRVCVRDLTGATSTCLDGTGGASDPFFSPDGSSIAFFAHDELRRVSAGGGRVTAIGPAAGGRTGTWPDNGTLLFADAHGILEVPATGGQARQVLARDPQREAAYLWPRRLPTGDIIFGVVMTGADLSESWIAVQAPSGGRRTMLLAGGRPEYDQAGGRLIYARGATLLAAPFNPRTRSVEPAVSFADGVMATAEGGAQFAISASGTIVYATGGAQPRKRGTVVWLDRRGTETALLPVPAGYATPRLSSDGGALAVAVHDISSDIWLYDLAAAVMRRVTVDHVNGDPAWSASGRDLAFGVASVRPQVRLFAGARFTDIGTWESRGAAVVRPNSWSVNNVLAVTKFGEATRGDIWLFGPSREAPDERPFARTPANEQAPAFSPDGRWIAFTTDVSGRNEVVVRAASGEGAAIPVSHGDGEEPLWAHTGREIFFRRGDALLAVPVAVNGTPRIGEARQLFSGPYLREEAVADYDVTRDDNHFVMVRSAPATATPQLQLMEMRHGRSNR